MAAKPGPTLPEVDAGHDAEFIGADDPVVVEATSAVQLSDLQSLDRLLADGPWLATSRSGDAGCHRTLLHAATDWPDNFPNGPTVVRRLVEAGADVNAHSKFDAHTETPLHWAASSDDVAVIDARPVDALVGTDR